MATGAIVGSSRFQNHDLSDGGSVEIGWTFLARSHWGRGYNADLKRLMLGHALGVVERAIFAVSHGNLRSRRAMEKVGGRLNGMSESVMIAAVPVLYVQYEITRESFAAGPLA